MPLDFETTGTELDFESTQDRGTNLYTDGAANDEAAMSSFMNEGDLERDFFAIKKDLQLVGRSQIVDDIKQRDLAFRKDTLTEAMQEILLDPNLSQQDREGSLRAATLLAGEDAARPVWAMFQNETVWNHSELDPEYKDQQTARWDELQDIRNAQVLIDDIKLKALPTLDGDEGSLLDVMGDFAELGVPLNHADTMQDLYKHMTGEAFGKVGWLVVGEMYHDLKNTFANLPTAEEKIEWANNLVSFLKQNDGLIKDSNGFETFILTNSLLDTTFVPGESFDIDRLLENVVSLLDVTIIGGMIVKAGKYPTRMLGTLNRTNPEMGRKVSGAVLHSPDPQAARTVNQSPESILRDGHFPSTSGKNLTGAPDDVVGAVREIDEELVGIFNKYVVDNPTQGRRVREMAEEYGGGRIHINKTHTKNISETEKELTVTVGRTRAAGYTTKAGAKKAAELRRLDDETLTFMKRGKSGNLVDASDDALGAKGEYFYQFKKKETIQPETPFIDFKDVQTVGSGLRTRNWLDVFSIFKKEDALKLSSAEDLKQGVTAQIFRAGKNFDNLKAEGKERVLSYIAKGSAERRTFSYEEAISGTDSMKPLTGQEFVAYSNLRAISDLVHKTENGRLVSWLKDNNYKALTGNDSIILYGKKTTIGDIEGARSMIDIRTGVATEITDAMRKGINSGEGEVYRLRSKESRGTDKYNFVYIPNSHLNKVKGIPDTALPYIDGYVYRRYNDSFFIERVDPRVKVDGAAKGSLDDQLSVIGSAEKQSDAVSLMARLRSETLTAQEVADGVTLRIRLGRESIRDMSEGEAAFQFAGMNGLLHKGTRGPLLNRIDSPNQGVIPVIDSIHSSMTKAASNLSIRPIVEKLERDFVKEFGGEGGFIPRGSDGAYHFPLDSKRFNPPITPDQIKTKKQMLASWEYINFLGRFEDPVTKNWRAGLLDIANWMDKKGWQNSFATKTLEKLGKRDPLDVLKGFTFTSFLALNPVRQLMVQLSQHMMLAPLDPRYVGTGRYAVDTSTLLYGAAIRTNKPAWAAQKGRLAKVRGISVQKYTKEVDDWMNSGLPTGVDSHNFLAGMLFNPTEMAGRTGAGKLTTRVLNGLKAPIRFARKIGFDSGEIGNLAVSWHIARRRLEKVGKAFKAEDVTNEARALALGMNRAGEFRYQRGYLKLTTQFFSMQHKALLTVLNAASGGKMGSRFFTKEEALRMASMQAFLFGAEGLGVYMLAAKIGDMYEDTVGEPMQPDAYEIMVNGLGTFMINQVISNASDNLEGTRLDFTSFAPLSGATHGVESILDLLFRSNEATIEHLMGASSSFVLRGSEQVKLAYEILQYPDPELGDGEKVVKAIHALGRGMSSGINNYYKGALASQEGFFRDNHGNATVRATAAEAWGKAIFGLGTFDDKEYYRLRMDKDKVNRSRKQQARLTARAIETVYADHKHLDANLLAEKLTGITLYVNLLPQNEREILRPLIFEELRKLSEGKLGSDNLIGSLLRDGAYDFPKFSSRAVSLIKDPKKRAALEKILEELNAEPERGIGMMHDDEEKE